MRKLYDCLLHHITTGHCIIKCALLKFSLTSTGWLKLEMDTFRPPSLGVRGKWGSWMSPFDSTPTGSYQFPIDTYDLSPTFLELFSWLQKRLRLPIRPPVRSRYDDKYRSRTTASSNGKNERICMATGQYPRRTSGSFMSTVKRRKLIWFSHVCHDLPL